MTKKAVDVERGIDPLSVSPKLAQARQFQRRLQEAAIALNDLAIDARLAGLLVVLPVAPAMGGDATNVTVRPRVFLPIIDDV